VQEDDALRLLETIRTGQFEGAALEVKTARRELPKRLYETLSAFANHTDGGTIVLGLDERRGFRVDGVADAQLLLRQLSDMAALMEPTLRLATLCAALITI